MEYASQQSLLLEEPQDFLNIPGQGVSGTIADQSVIIGNATFMTKRLGSTTVQNFSESTEGLANAGKTPIFVDINGQVEGVIGIADTIRLE